MRKPFWFALAVALVLPAVTLAIRYWPRADPRVLPDDAVDLSVDYSNILPEDYVGPETCAACHSRRFEQWSHHPHSNMNRLPTPETVRGDFSGQTLDLGHGNVRFAREAGAYYITLEQRGQLLRRYEVTRTVGSRYMQFYIGKQLVGPEPAGSPLYGEHMLPFAFWITLDRWLPKPFFDPDGPEQLEDGLPLVEGLDYVRDIRPFNQVCMNCHNTFAYSYRIFQPMLVGFPGATVAAAVGPLSTRLSPMTPVEPSAADFARLNGRLDPERHLLTIGISCESCHLGGREHAVSGRPIRFAPTSPLIKFMPHALDRPITGERRDPPSINGICAQCHSGNAHLYPNGAAQANSREALDFVAGACASKLTCVQCHDPHVAGPPSGGPDRPQHVELCVACHQQYQQPAAALAHGRHAQQITCLDCHMSRQTLGLDQLVRSHRIALPVEVPMVHTGSVNACNLCHLDRSLRWTLTELEKGWGRTLTTTAPPAVLDQPASDLWLHSSEQMLRVVATQSLARSRFGRQKLADLYEALDDPEPINRVFALKAVERVTGQKLGPEDYCLTAGPAQRRKQIQQLCQKPHLQQNGRRNSDVGVNGRQ